MDESKQIFTQILNSLSEKEMKSFINKYCKTNKAMVNKFVSMFAHKIEGNCEKKFSIIINNSLNSCINMRNRFIIDHRKVNNALRPVFKLLKEEQNSYHEKPYESFVLVRFIIMNFACLIEDFYAIHKFDLIDELFDETLSLLNSIYHAKSTPYEFKEEILNYILDISQEEVFDSIKYNQYIDLRLLRIVISKEHQENNQKILDVIDKKIVIKKDKEKDFFNKLKLEIIEQNI